MYLSVILLVFLRNGRLFTAYVSPTTAGLQETLLPSLMHFFYFTFAVLLADLPLLIPQGHHYFQKSMDFPPPLPLQALSSLNLQ